MDFWKIFDIKRNDAAFHNLLGLLLVLVFIRLHLPLHKIMVAELAKRNEILDLAEADGCTEFDVFCKAFENYSGTRSPKKAEKDFTVYLRNWPDTYIPPYYMRLYLDMRKKGEAC